MWTVSARGPQRARTLRAIETGQSTTKGAVTFGQFESRLYELKDTSRTVIAEGRGKWDGVEALDDGRILFSSWSDSSIHVVERGRDRQLITGVATAADIGIDTRRRRIAIPLAGAGRVDIWTIPDAQ